MNNEPILYSADGEKLKLAHDLSFWVRIVVYMAVTGVVTLLIVALLAPEKKANGPMTMGPVSVSQPIPLGALESFSFYEHEGFQDQPAPSDHPPKRIVVDGSIFTVHYARRSELLAQGCLGATLLREQQIWLPADETGRGIRETMLHELMHVALNSAGGEFTQPVLSDHGDGEPVINPSARMLLSILHDNPKLVAWLETR